MEANLKVEKPRVRKSRPRTVFETDLTKMMSETKKPPDTKKNPNFQPYYAVRSIDLWVSNIYKLFIGLGYEDLSLELLNNHQEIREYIVKKYEKLNTRQAIYNSIIMFYRPDFLQGVFSQEILDMYLNARFEVQSLLKQRVQVNQNQKEVLDKKSGITKEEITKLMDLLKSQSVYEGNIIHRQKYMLYLILFIHSHYPFRNDLATMRVIKKTSFNKLEKEQKDNMNFLVIDKKTMYFVRDDYKMKGKYGALINPINNKPLRKAIDLWLSDGLNLYEDPHKLDFTYLLSQDNGTPISRNNLSQILSRETKRYLGRPISTTLLAKIYDITPTSVETATLEEMNEVKKQAQKRGHSTQVKITHYKN